MTTKTYFTIFASSPCYDQKNPSIVAVSPLPSENDIFRFSTVQRRSRTNILTLSVCSPSTENMGKSKTGNIAGPYWYV